MALAFPSWRQFVPLATEHPDDPEGGTPSEALLRSQVAKALGWLTGIWTAACIVVAVVRGDWWQVLRCLPGSMFGMSLACMVSQAKVEPQQVPAWLFSAWCMFLCLLNLPFVEMTWQGLIFAAVVSLLSACGIQAHECGVMTCDRCDLRRLGFFLLLGIVVIGVIFGIVQLIQHITWNVYDYKYPDRVAQAKYYHPYGVAQASIDSIDVRFWCKYWPWTSLFLLFAMEVGLWGCPVLSRKQLLSRILVSSILLVAPLLVHADIEGWQSEMEIPDVSPFIYINVNLQNFSQPLQIERKHLHWLQMPQPLWPTEADLAKESGIRSHFWFTYMSFKFVFATTFIGLVLGCNCRSGSPQNSSLAGEEGKETTRTLMVSETPGREETKAQGAQKSFVDEEGRVILPVVLGTHLVLCSTMSISAAFEGRLRPATGLDFEGYDVMLSAGLLWLIAQALAVRSMDLTARYSVVDIVLSTLFLVPFLGDGFDSLKDAMLASNAMSSDLAWLQFLGGAALLYLFCFHARLLYNPSNWLELQRSYMSCFFLKSQKLAATKDAEEPQDNSLRSFCNNVWLQLSSLRQKFYALLFQQTSPSRQRAMMIEDAPQGALACLVSLAAGGFQPFTLVVNIALPLVRLAVSLLFHDWIAWQVTGWILEEAEEARGAGHLQICDELVAALHRLQVAHSREELWRSLKDMNENGCRMVKDGFLSRWRQGHEDQTSLDVFIFQLLGEELSDQFTRAELQFKVLQHSQIFAFGARALGDGLAKFVHLTTLKLNLEDSAIGCEGAKGLSDSLSKLGNLTTMKLNLEVNLIGTEGAKGLSDGLSKLGNLTTLDLNLGRNKILSEGATGLGDGLSKLGNLTTLDLNLESNGIGPRSARGLGDHLSKLGNLTSVKLNLKLNRFRSVAFDVEEQLHQTIRDVTVLADDYLSQGNISDALMQNLSISFTH